MVEVMGRVGLVDAEIRERFDTYAGTSSGAKLSPKMGLRGVNLYARNP